MSVRILQVAVASAVFAASGIAFSAQPIGSLARINGTVLVNQGEQYRTGIEGMALRPGDRIMAMSAGSAVIQFADGCAYDLDDNEVLTIGPTSTCSADTVAKTEIGKYYAQPGAPIQGAPSYYGWQYGAIFGVTAGVAASTGNGPSGRPGISR